MELYEVLNKFCNRDSNSVSKEDKKRFSYMLRRLFAAQYPIQCELINRLDSDALCSANIVAILASRYNGLPQFLRLKINQKKKNETIRTLFEDDVLNMYMEINECGIREVEEAYNFNPESVTNALKLIKKNFFNDKDKVIVKKLSKKEIEEAKKKDKEEELF